MNPGNAQTTQGKPAGRTWVVLRLGDAGWKPVLAWIGIAVASAIAGGATMLAVLAFAERPAERPQVAETPTQAETPADAAAAAPAEPAARRIIDGAPMDEEQKPLRYFAVVIDNLTVARPQAGIAAAPLVIEAPVEGGITRLLAIYPEGMDVPRVGPVRSARPYFLDWASEFDALFTHVGGSPEALEKLAAYDMRDLNEFFAGAYFSRDRSKSAPHNVFTSLEDLAAADAKRHGDRELPVVAGWRFKQDAAADERPETAAMRVKYGDSRMDVTWAYARETNDYVRSQGGREHRDEDGSPVRAKNIVVQYAKVSVIDDVGRRRITTVGEGDALIAIDGIAVHGTWRKDARDARTRFYDASGNQIRFNAGPTWIEVVPTGTDVES